MRLSGRLQLAPTPRVIKQLGMVERFAGEWSRIGKAGVFNSDREREATLGGAQAALALDSTSPPGVSTFLVTVTHEENGGNGFTADELPVNRHLEHFLAAFQGRL